MLIVDELVVNRMVEIEIDNLRSRIAGYRDVAIRSFGEAVAFLSPHSDERFFNSVQGTSEATLPHLDAIEHFYGQHALRPAFEIVPSRLTEELGMQLARRGYGMVEFHAGLACCPLVAPPGNDAITIEEVQYDDEFAELYTSGWQSAAAETVRHGMRAWREVKAFRFFVAQVGGRAVGAAVLDTRGKTALLGSAATLPSHRGQGVQRALISRRMLEAARSGCDLLVGGAYFGTSSMRNQQRAGLSIAFTRGIWTPRHDLPI